MLNLHAYNPVQLDLHQSSTRRSGKILPLKHIIHFVFWQLLILDVHRFMP